MLRRLMLLVGLLASAAAAAPPPAVPMRLPDTVQPLAYRLHLQVDPEQPRYGGEVEIDLRLRQPIAANGTLRLHAKDLLIRSAWLEVGARRLSARVQRLDDERIALRFGRVLPAGAVRLGLAFAGTLDDHDVYGLFRQQAGGSWLAFTQFEASGARRAFPLFDEPGWKVPWTLSLTVPQALQAVSNMPVQSEEPDGPGFKRVSFQRTPPLPSYLLAFAVGDLALRDAGLVGRDRSLPMRFVTPAGRAGEADYAAGGTGRIVDRLEAWFDMPYPFAKLDSLAIPVTSQFGAMEHPGLISYASTLLLASPGEQTPASERDYLATAAHELAHQWFGNLVTPAWWDDLWLNESFASWLGDKIADEVLPDAAGSTRVQRARARAMQADRLVSAHAIEHAVQTDDDMGNLWDAITYDKGQTVLAMFEAWLGPQAFQAGVRRYIRRHAWGSATRFDFFQALAGDDPALPAALRSFTRQGGIPRVRLTLRCDDGPPRLQLAQSRLLPLGSSGGDAADQRWQLPLLLRTPAGRSRLLMTDGEATLALPDTACPAWVLANAGGAGYYRVAYAGDLLARLIAAPGDTGETGPALTPAEWLVLLDDAQGLHDAGALDNAQVLALVQAGAAQPTREVVLAAMTLLRHLRPLVAPGQQAAYAGLWQAAFSARARALGWQPRAGDSDDDRLLRVELLPALAALGEDAALRAEALRLARDWLADPKALGAELRGPVLATAALADGGEAAAGQPTLFDALRAALDASDDRNERGDLLAALGHFRQPDLAQRARQLLLAPTIDLRDSLWPLLGAQAAEPSTRDAALDFVARHHAELAGRIGHDGPAALPSLFRHGCSDDEAQRTEAAFVHQAARHPGGRQALARTLEAVRLCSAWRARQSGGLQARLNERIPHEP
jgi:alanyl aminopeptidase